MDLGDGHHLGRVEVVPVAEFVRQHGFYFFRLALLDEGIENDDVLGLVIGMSTSAIPNIYNKKRTHGRPKK